MQTQHPHARTSANRSTYLGSVRVSTGVGHGEQSRTVMLQLKVLICEGVEIRRQLLCARRSHDNDIPAGVRVREQCVRARAT